jgi:dihydrofolate reductase
VGGQKGNPFSAFFDNTPKHVVTRQTDYHPRWQNSHVVSGDTDAALATLHSGPTDYLVFGSGQLVTRLAELGLVDRYVLLIHPVVLGSGYRFGLGLTQKQGLKLVEVRSTSSGVLIATYSAADPMER